MRAALKRRPHAFGELVDVVSKGGPATKFAVKSALVYGRQQNAYAFEAETGVYSLAAKKAPLTGGAKTSVPLTVAPKKNPRKLPIKAASGGAVVSGSTT